MAGRMRVRPNPQVPSHNDTDPADNRVKINQVVRSQWRTVFMFGVPVAFVLFVRWALTGWLYPIAFNDAYAAEGCVSGNEMTPSLVNKCIQAGTDAEPDLHEWWKIASYMIAVWLFFMIRRQITVATPRHISTRVVRQPSLLTWPFRSMDWRKQQQDDHAQREQARIAKYNALPVKERRRKVPFVVHIIGALGLVLALVTLFIYGAGWFAFFMTILTIALVVVLYFLVKVMISRRRARP